MIFSIFPSRGLFSWLKDLNSKLLLIILPIIFVSTSLNPTYSQHKYPQLTEQHRHWLEEEVVYIITPIEKDVFLNLKNSKERDLFIEAFWRRRDPTPGTEKNEFREEHYRRLNYVNRRYKYAGKPGWKTDRGKVYIILGAPNDIRIFQGNDAYYPAELWSYQGIDLHGLPPAFNLLFFQKGRIGDYILYNPAMMGPQTLLASYFMKDPTDVMAAYYRLEEIQPMLAQASLSLIPNEPATHHPSMASVALIQSIDGALIRSIDDTYAKKFIQYKDIIEVEYSTNYIDSNAQLYVFKDKSGIPFVHFSLEPKNLSMGSYENNVYTSLDFNGILYDTEQNLIYQFEKTVRLNFAPQQFESIRYRPFDFTGKFPLIPGNFRFSFLMKNRISKEFTSYEVSLKIPESEKFTMTPLLLGFNIVPIEPQKTKSTPFSLADHRIYSQPRKVFNPRDTLFVFFQIWSLPEKVYTDGLLKYTFSQEEKIIKSFTRPLKAYQNNLNFLESVPLISFKPGYYKINVSLLDGNGVEIANRQDIFVVTSSSLPRPWVMSLSQKDNFEQYQISYLLGKQFYNKRDFQNAFVLLNNAYSAEPSNFEYALALARVNFSLSHYQETLKILQPFEKQIQQKYELITLLGKTNQALGNFAKAVQYYRQALENFGTNTSLLNSLGECFLSLGEKKKALDLFQKSLEIDPRQEKIKKTIQQLKN
jgi:GWxTD domain-containing protein